MRLIDIENQIKALLEEGITDERVYKKIYDLIYFYLMRKKLMSTALEAEEVAQIGAAELYLRILNGHEIYCWLGYISRSYHAYIRAYNKMCKSELIDVDEDILLKNAVVEMSMGNRERNDFRDVLNRVFFENMYTLVDEVMEASKYDEHSSLYLNARLSLMMSIIHGAYTPHKLSEVESMYVRMLYARVKERVSKEIRDTMETYDNYELLDLFNLSFVESSEA